MIRLLAAMPLLLACAQAADPVPSWVKDLTTARLGPYLTVPPCEVVYELGWNHLLTAGKASLSVKEAGGFWRADATAASTGLARGLWKYDCEMTSIINRQTLQPRFLSHSETDREETCHYRVVFEPQRVLTETTVIPKKGTTTKSTAICPYGPVEDLLSVILYVRSQALTPGQKITRVVQPWDKPYLTTFEVHGRESLDIAGKKRPCIKVDVKIRKIDRTTLDLSSYKKMKTSTIWISDDALRLPLEMHAEIFVGYMFARMTGLKMLNGADGMATVPPRMDVKPPTP